MKTFLQKKKVMEEPKKSQITSQTKENPFLSGNETTTNPFTNSKSAPAQFSGLGGFLKAGKRLAGNILGGKGIKNSINDVKSHNSEKREKKDAGGNVSMGYVLKNPKLRDMFYAFLVKEHNVENLECYELLQRVKQNNLLFMDMYNLYISTNSSMQANISGKVVKKSTDLAEKLKTNPHGQAIDTSLLDTLDKELETNLADPYARFSTSSEFENRHKVN